MAAVSLFWDTNMAAVTSCENTLYGAFDELLGPGSGEISNLVPRALFPGLEISGLLTPN